MSAVAVGDTVVALDDPEPWTVTAIYPEMSAYGDCAVLVDPWGRQHRYELTINLRHVGESIESMFDCE